MNQCHIPRLRPKYTLKDLGEVVRSVLQRTNSFHPKFNQWDLSVLLFLLRKFSIWYLFNQARCKAQDKKTTLRV